jgi:hypothetical protein
MTSDEDGLDGLGSLAQSARSKHLKTAKVTLIAVGVLTILGNVVFAVAAESMVQQAIDKELRGVPAGQIDQEVVAELKKQAVTTTRLVSGAFVAVGVVFIFLGLFVSRAPVACTATGLVLYLAGWAITGVLDPSMIFKGALLKVIIIVALVKALKAAIAFQKEESATLEAA